MAMTAATTAATRGQPALELSEKDFNLMRDLIVAARSASGQERTLDYMHGQADLVMAVLEIDPPTYRDTVTAAIEAGAPIAVMITTPVEI